MPFKIAPQFWALVSTVLAVFGVVYVPSDAVKSAVAAAAGLVLSVWQWQHHATIRHNLSTAATLAGQKLDLRIAEANAQEQTARLAIVAPETPTPAPAIPPPAPAPAPQTITTAAPSAVAL